MIKKPKAYIWIQSMVEIKAKKCHTIKNKPTVKQGGILGFEIMGLGVSEYAMACWWPTKLGPKPSPRAKPKGHPAPYFRTSRIMPLGGRKIKTQKQKAEEYSRQTSACDQQILYTRSCRIIGSCFSFYSDSKCRNESTRYLTNRDPVVI